MKKSIQFAPESSLAQQCYDQLRQEIIQGLLVPGEKLKVEPIKERFGIGQSPVREALSRLSAFGLVDVEENKGFRVAPVSLRDIRDTYKVFTAIETTALAWAIKHGDDIWQADIVTQLYKLSIVEQSKQHVSYAEWSARNYDFHVALISGCNSPTLLEMRRHIYMKFDRYCQISYQLSKHLLESNHERHQELAQTVLSRDTLSAIRLMTEHINEPLEDVILQLSKNNIF